MGKCLEEPLRRDVLDLARGTYSHKRSGMHVLWRQQRRTIRRLCESKHETDDAVELALSSDLPRIEIKLDFGWVKEVAVQLDTRDKH